MTAYLPVRRNIVSRLYQLNEELELQINENFWTVCCGILGISQDLHSFKMIINHERVQVYIDALFQGLGAVYQGIGYEEVIPGQIQVGHSIVHFKMYDICIVVAHWGNQCCPKANLLIFLFG